MLPPSPLLPHYNYIDFIFRVPNQIVENPTSTKRSQVRFLRFYTSLIKTNLTFNLSWSIPSLFYFKLINILMTNEYERNH